MANRPLLLAVVVLLIVSSMVVLAAPTTRGAPAATPPRASGSHPAISTLEMFTSSGSCPTCNISSYTSGAHDQYGDYGTNILYFAFYDPTADKMVNFTVADQNASRDGVAQPAYHVEVPNNNVTYEYYSYETGLSYTFPANLKIGGWWTVNVTAPLGGSVQYNISVSTFYTTLTGTPAPNSPVLPGESIVTVYQALSLVNNAPDTSITNVAAEGWYFGANDTYLSLTNGIVVLPVTAYGNYTWMVPANATYGSYIYLDIWMTINVNGKVAENESFEAEYNVGRPYFAYVYMESNNAYGGYCRLDGGYQDYYQTGSYVQFCGQAGVLGSYDNFVPLAGLPVSISFWNGTNSVTPPGNPPTMLTSNSTGIVAFSFYANIPQFSTYYRYPFYNSVNISIVDSAAKPVPVNHDFKFWGNYSFWMEPAENAVGVTVTLNQLAYFPGQAISATWTLSSNTSKTGSLTVSSWQLTDGRTGAYLSGGTISSSASTGTVQVKLPSGYLGPFMLQVNATNATESFSGAASAIVQAPTLALNPSSLYFSPGGSVTLTAVDWGAGGLGSGAVITYQIYEYYGYTDYGGGGFVGSGTVANGSSFTINVPSTGAPYDYEVYAYLSSPSAGTVASTEVTLDQSWGYNVLIGVSTLSKYSDGSFQPGETITVTYQISPFGHAPLPVVYTFEVFMYDTQVGGIYSTTSTSGSFQLTIPSNWPSGIVFLELELTGAYLYGNACGGGYCYGETAITVNANPSVLSLDLSPGSGLTLGWLILFLIILIVVIVGVVVWVRHRRAHPPSPPSGGSPPATNVTEPMNPPAPAPSSPGAAEWQPPASGGESQPPLPTPPPGAT